MQLTSRMLLGVLLIALALAGCDDPPQKTGPPPVSPSPAEEGTIVCMGDSLTAGYGVEEAEAYPALLEDRLHAAGYRYRVVNAGVSGETSSGALSRLDWMLTLDPDIVILETGANDGLRGVDPDLTRRNIAAIVNAFQDRDIVVVLAGMQMVRNLGSAFTESFRALYPDIAQSTGAILIPFFLEGVAGRPALNQADGIHPTAEGYRVIVEHIYPYVLQGIERHGERAAGTAAQ
jgi:acyl-CoA thioesterase-1